jgi:HEPN domain-containing protein
LRAFSLSGNYTRVQSAIEYEESYTNELGEHVIKTAERVMQGQAPWTANLSALFSEPAWGTSVNVLFNKVGRRLDAVGDTRDEDVYEEPRTLVDVAVTQHLGRGFETKFAVKNVGAKEIAFTSGPLREEYATVSVGTEYSFSFTYKF